MGIRLDWQVESEIGRSAVEEDAEVIAARRRRGGVTRNLLIAALVFAVLITAGVLWRLRQIEAERRAVLENVVAAETAALRLSDRNAFMFRQGPSEDWRDHQRLTFDELQRFQSQVVVTDEILEIDVSGDEARVSVRVLIDGEPDEAVWLYEYTERGWRHVGTEAEPWSKQGHASQWLTFAYYPTDRAYAEALDAWLTAAWSKMLQHTGLEPLRIRVVIDPDAATVEWANEDAVELIVPSDVASRFAQGAPPDAAAVDQLAVIIADRWTTYAIGERGWLMGGSIMREMGAYLLNAVNPAAPPSDLARCLEQAFGPRIMPTFFAETQGDHSSYVALRNAIVANADQATYHFDLHWYLNGYLCAEAAFSDSPAGDIWTPPDVRVMQVFYAERAQSPSDRPPVIFPNLGSVEPGDIEVLETRQFREVLWATVRYRTTLPWMDGSGKTEMIGFIPFRMVDGYWARTLPGDEAWGDVVHERGEHVNLVYNQIDAPHARRLVRYLDRVYEQAAATMGIEDQPPATVTIASNWELFRREAREEPGIDGYVNTLYGSGGFWGGDDIDRAYFAATGETLIREMMGYQNGSLIPYYYPEPIIARVLLLRLNQEILGDDWTYGYYDTPQTLRRVSLPDTLDDIWFETYEVVASEAEAQSELALKHLAADVFIDMMIERYGDEAIPAMARNFAPSMPNPTTPQTVDEWLDSAFGLAREDIERDWYLHVHAEMREQGIIP